MIVYLAMNVPPEHDGDLVALIGIYAGPEEAESHCTKHTEGYVRVEVGATFRTEEVFYPHCPCQERPAWATF